jgi:hypothetical protein
MGTVLASSMSPGGALAVMRLTGDPQRPVEIAVAQKGGQFARVWSLAPHRKPGSIDELRAWLGVSAKQQEGVGQ